MNIELNLIMSTLKLTKERVVLIDAVNKDARIPAKTSLQLLKKMQNEGNIHLESGFVEVDSNSRMKLALKAVSLGADIENVCDLLCWREFEDLASVALENNGYIVKKNVHFKYGERRWEMDAVGCKKPLVVCIDCKHWHHGLAASALNKIVKSQIQRTKALADSLPNISLSIECTKWSKADFIPAVLTLIPSAFKFCDKVPVIPILQLQNFLYMLPGYINELKSLPKTFNSLKL